jgi:hypothetical protein
MTTLSGIKRRLNKIENKLANSGVTFRVTLYGKNERDFASQKEYYIKRYIDKRMHNVRIVFRLIPLMEI